MKRVRTLLIKYVTAIAVPVILAVSAVNVIGQGGTASAVMTARASAVQSATARPTGEAVKTGPAHAESSQPPYTLVLPGRRKPGVQVSSMRVDMARTGSPHQGKSGPVAPGGARPAVGRSAAALKAPAVCPKKPDGELYANRFAMCQYWKGKEIVEVEQTVDGVPVSAGTMTVNYTLELWAEMAEASREWAVGAIFAPTSVAYENVPLGVTLTAFAGLACSGRACHVTGGPAKGELGVVEEGVSLETGYVTSDTGTSAVVDLNNSLALHFETSGNGVVCVSNCEAETIFAFAEGSLPVIRCDSAGISPAPASACVVWIAPGNWVVTSLANPGMGIVVKHMAMATGNLPGYNGLPGDPGKNSPLTYDPAKEAANRAAACDHATRLPGEPAVNNSCDEYPMARTDEGAASGKPYSICWVPVLQNKSQGGAFTAFLRLYRMNPGEKFFVHATYTGNAAGCTDNLGGGGPVTTDNHLDGMFGSYGNNATCADWSGGDATNSVVLPNGERAWFFSDTFLNSPTARKGLWYASSLHNSMVIQDSGGIARTITGGNTCKETDLSIPFDDRYAKSPATAPDGGFYWTADQMVAGSQVVKFYYYGYASANSFYIDFPAVAAIPVSSLEHDSVITVHPLGFACGAAGIIWGTALLNWGGYVYIYGWKQNGLSDNIYLARASAANLAITRGGANPDWQVYNGMSGSNPVWGSCASTPVALAIHGTTGFSVGVVNGGLWLVQFDYADGQVNTAGDIGAHPSATPWGFGNDTVELYDPPTGQRTYPYFYQDYEARLQPLLGAAGQVVISYNVNTSAVDTGCVSANRHDATIYRPRFIDVPVTDFNPNAAKPAPGTASAASWLSEAMAGLSSSGIDGSTDWFYKPLGAPCPTIGAPPKAPSLKATSSPGILEATWQNMGSDVWYYGWVCDKTEHNCSTEGTSGVWFPAWPTNAGNLWSTRPSSLIDPIDATSTPSRNTNGDTFAFYVRSFGAGNGNGGGNSPEVTAKVSR